MKKLITYLGVGMLVYVIGRKISDSFDSGWISLAVYFAICRVADIKIFYSEDEKLENDQERKN